MAYSEDEGAFINLYAKPNSPVLGKRLGKQFKDFKQQIEALSADQIDQLQTDGSLELSGESFSPEDVLVFREAREGTDALSDKFVSIELVCELNDELIKEGLAREVVNRIQKSRKDLQLQVTDRITLLVAADDDLIAAIQAHEAHVMSETLTTSLAFTSDPTDIEFDIDGARLGLTIQKA